MFCCTLLYVHSSIAIILMGKKELIVLLNLSSWCLVMVERLFLTVPRGSLQFVIVVFPDHTHLLFLPVYALQYFTHCMEVSCWHFFIRKSALLFNDTLLCKRLILIYLHARELFMFLFSSADFLQN